MNYSRGGSECRYPPNQFLFLCTFKEAIGRHEDHVHITRKVVKAKCLGFHKVVLFVCVLAMSLLVYKRFWTRFQSFFLPLFCVIQVKPTLRHQDIWLVYEEKKVNERITISFFMFGMHPKPVFGDNHPNTLFWMDFEHFNYFQPACLNCIIKANFINLI